VIDMKKIIDIIGLWVTWIYVVGLLYFVKLLAFAGEVTGLIDKGSIMFVFGLGVGCGVMVLSFARQLVAFIPEEHINRILRKEGGSLK
jgi:hypothetical protein